MAEMKLKCYLACKKLTNLGSQNEVFCVYTGFKRTVWMKCWERKGKTDACKLARNFCF